MEPNDLERAVELGARVTRAAVGLGVSLALAPLRLALRAVYPAPEETRWEPAPPPAEPVAPVRVAPEPPVATPAAPRDGNLSSADAARQREAEREARATPESSGPELRVEEPWEGYDAMNVADVLGRLKGVNATVLAMVRLYEETHKSRKGILRVTG